MIISSCPTRISLGSADHSPFAERWGGIALNFCINKRVYVVIRKRNSLERFKYRISYSKTELCNSIDEIENSIVRGALDMLDMDMPLEIIYSSDVPTRLGLGTSSSFTLAMLKGLYMLRNASICHEILADKAYKLERINLKEAGGFQDQYSCFGGINYLTGSPPDVRRRSIPLGPEQAKDMEQHMLLIYTGKQGNSPEVLSDQLKKLKKGKTLEETIKIKRLVEEMFNILSTRGFSLMDLTYPMKEAWELKKKLASNMVGQEVEEIEQLILDVAPYAGYRLVGSGGGRGLVLALVKPEDRDKIIEKCKSFKTAPVEFDWDGAIVNVINGRYSHEQE